MTEKALVKSNGTQSVALDGYGKREAVREMEERILAMIPGASKYSPAERRALAQIATAHKLDVLNGEAWVIPGSGAIIGIKGLRKLAHQQIAAIGGNFWVDYQEVTDEERRKRYRVAPGDLAFEARLYDSDNIRTYTETVRALLAAGLPWDAVEKMVGTKPYTSGFGVLRASEKTRMEPVQCAWKRAEANALKQRFDVPFGVAVADDDTGEIVEGHATSGPDYTDPAFVSGQMDAEQVKADSAAVFGE